MRQLNPPVQSMFVVIALCQLPVCGKPTVSRTGTAGPIDAGFHDPLSVAIWRQQVSNHSLLEGGTSLPWDVSRKPSGMMGEAGVLMQDSMLVLQSSTIPAFGPTLETGAS